VIDRVPEIDAYKEGGHEGSLNGRLEFRNCTFCYPSRPDAVVLKNFSLVIEAGQTVALVGQSGSGPRSKIIMDRCQHTRRGRERLRGNGGARQVREVDHHRAARALLRSRRGRGAPLPFPSPIMFGRTSLPLPVQIGHTCHTCAASRPAGSHRRRGCQGLEPPHAALADRARAAGIGDLWRQHPREHHVQPPPRPS